MEKFQVIGEVIDPALPDGIKALGSTISYKVIDHVETMPKGIWGSTVESTYEFTNVELGLFVRIKSPLNVVMDTAWEIRETDGGLELVEDSTIKCSRLLVGIVKSLNEGGCKLFSQLDQQLAPTCGTIVEPVWIQGLRPRQQAVIDYYCH